MIKDVLAINTMTRDELIARCRQGRIRIANIYADGGVILKNPSTIGGTYAFCFTDANDEFIYGEYAVVEPRNGVSVTNNQTEYIALVKGLELVNECHERWEGLVSSDSYVSLGRLFSRFKLTNLTIAMIRRGQAAVASLGINVTHRLLKGHPTNAELELGYGVRKGSTTRLPVSKWNKWCDKRCGEAAETFLNKRNVN